MNNIKRYTDWNKFYFISLKWKKILHEIFWRSIFKKEFYSFKEERKFKVQKSKERSIANQQSLGQENKLSNIAMLLRIFPWFFSERKDYCYEEDHVNTELFNMSFSDRNIYLTQWWMNQSF